MRHTHLLTILYADQQSINKVPKIWGQLNEKGNGSSPRRRAKKRVWLARLVSYPGQAVKTCSLPFRYITK